MPQEPADGSLDNIIGKQGQKFVKLCVAIQSADALLIQVEYDTLHLHPVKMRLFFHSSSWKVS